MNANIYEVLGLLSLEAIYEEADSIPSLCDYIGNELRFVPNRIDGDFTLLNAYMK